MSDMDVRITLDKTEEITALLNQWNPEGRYKSFSDVDAYRYEADTIAHDIRKNSSLKSVQRMIVDALAETELDDGEVEKMAGFILEAVKR